MRSFEEIEALAAEKKGGPEALDALLAEHNAPRTAEELEKVGDDRWLAMFTKCVFQAGFSWKVIDQKWPGFEEAFEGSTFPASPFSLTRPLKLCSATNASSATAPRSDLCRKTRFF